MFLIKKQQHKVIKKLPKISRAFIRSLLYLRDLIVELSTYAQVRPAGG